MAVGNGTRLGPYEVVAPIGAGGMGEVYRARDPRLRREVAIKVLPLSFSLEASRLRRFEQEARAAAGLNHHNILSVHDFGMHDGVPYIVTELLEGETLRSRLRVGAIPVRKAIEQAAQIARGLAAAHDKNIVHRDLKPENIFVTRDGTVKILDFGLAKLMERPQASLEATRTLDSDAGMVVGTVGYMSPEQVRGKAVDARSDVFAFGAILYEMLSGRRAFHGDSVADTLSAILTKDPPDLTQTDAEIPPMLHRIVHHCLEKLPEERFQAAGDIAFALESIGSSSGSSSAVLPAVVTRRSRVDLRVAAAVLVLIAFALGLLLGRGLVSKGKTAAYKQLTFRRGKIRTGRFAPGGQVVYTAAWDGNRPEVFISNISTPGSSATGLRAEDIEAISASGEVLLISDRHFVNSYVRPGILSRAALSGAAPRPLVEDVQDADWSADATKIAAARLVNGQFQLEFPVGNVIYQTNGWITQPRVSPDGKSVAFLEHPVSGDDAGTVALIGSDGKKRTLTPNYTSIETLAWRSPEELWFSAADSGTNSNVFAVDLRGRVRTVVQGPGGLRLLDVGSDGRAVIAQGRVRVSAIALGSGETHERDISVADWSLAMDISDDGSTALIDEEGEGTPGGYSVYVRKTDGSAPVRLGEGSAIRLSPNGKWVLSQTSPPSQQLQILPTGAGERRSLASNEIQPALSNNGCWLPDNSHIAFAGVNPKGERRIYLQDIGGGAPRPITTAGLFGAVRCSQDGRKIAVSNHTETLVVSMDGSPPRVVPGAQANEFALAWSSDDKALLMGTPLQVPAKIYRLEIATGKRELIKELAPQDLTGVEGVGPVAITPDARHYVYGVGRELNDLYVVDGLK